MLRLPVMPAAEATMAAGLFTKRQALARVAVPRLPDLAVPIVNPPQLSLFEALSDELLAHVLCLGGWNAETLANVACTSQRLARAARVTLWREFCLAKAPKTTRLLVGSTGKVVEGGWAAYSKLMRFCPGAHTSPQFEVQSIPQHVDRLGKIFSKSAGRRLLVKSCRRDVLFLTEACEHLETGEEVGVFRGIVKKFSTSRVRRQLELRRAAFEEARCCPFCGMAVWSLAAAGLVAPSIVDSLSCARDEEGGLDCDVLVCLHGHLHGMCILAELDPDTEDEEEEDEDEEDGSTWGQAGRHGRQSNRALE